MRDWKKNVSGGRGPGEVERVRGFGGGQQRGMRFRKGVNVSFRENLTTTS